MSYCSRAFTLIELLVSISIISVLIALMLPALGAARMAARVTQASSQMRQVQLALLGYAYDNDGSLPYSTNNYDYAGAQAWGGLIFHLGYVTSPRVFWGPLRDTAWFEPDLEALAANRLMWKWGYTGITINGGIAPAHANVAVPPTYAPVRVDAPDVPASRTLSLFEGHRKDYRPDVSGVMRDGWYGGNRGGGQQAVLTYDRVAVVSYLDGHGRSAQAETIGWQVDTQTWSLVGNALQEPWFYQVFLKPR